MIDTRASIEVELSAPSVVVMEVALGVLKGAGPFSVWPTVVVSDTTCTVFSGSLLVTGTGMASGEDTTVVLPSAYVCVKTIVVMLVSKI